MINKTKNKKAWLRIVEATISIMLILGVAILFYQTKQSSSEDNIQDKLPVFLDEIAKNDSLRNKTINEGDTSIVQSSMKTFLASKMNRINLNYTVVVCDIDDSCSPSPPINTKSDIFSAERIISTTIEKDNFNILATPKKVKIYAWRMNS